MKYSTVLIDLDDTLLDFHAASDASLRSLMERLGHPINDDEAHMFETINAACWRELELGLIDRYDLSFKRFYLFFEELGITFHPLDANDIFRAGLSESAVLIPGALELCERLKKLTSLYLVTNGFVETQQKRISAAGLDGMFIKTFASQAVGWQKPDPRFFDAVFAEIGEDKRGEAIILGDSLTSDMAGGRAAGIATCWFNRHGGRPSADCDFSITSLDRFIPDILEGKI